MTNGEVGMAEAKIRTSYDFRESNISIKFVDSIPALWWLQDDCPLLLPIKSGSDYWN
jgi:hypothetical protein